MAGHRPWARRIGVVAAAVVVCTNPGVQRRIRTAARRLSHKAVYLAGCARGVRYRQRGGHPDLDVDDTVLADRVRSALGRVGKQLDIPHPHVMVEDHVVLLHGDVPTEGDRAAVEEAAADVAGVEGVESYLHVGLLPSDTRPSEGRIHRPRSEALVRLLDAARDAGAGEQGAVTAVGGVLAALFDRLPADEADHLLVHLPADVRAVTGGPRLHRLDGDHDDVDAFVRAAAGAAGRDPAVAGAITASVLGALRQLVPEEAADVAAVLPAGLRRFWNAAVPL